MREVLVESGEFSDGARFFSRPALRSWWFIVAICSMAALTAGYLYIVIAHWNQLSFAFVSWVYNLLLLGAVGTLCGSWRMHARLHEMFLADVVKIEPRSPLDESLNVAARAIEMWLFMACNALLIAFCFVWWGLRHAGVLR